MFLCFFVFCFFCMYNFNEVNNINVFSFSFQKSIALTSDTSHQGKILKSLKLKLREVSSVKPILAWTDFILYWLKNAFVHINILCSMHCKGEAVEGTYE